jgi:hypothetical protein
MSEKADIECLKNGVFSNFTSDEPNLLKAGLSGGSEPTSEKPVFRQLARGIADPTGSE